MNNNFHVSTTFMPDGSVFAGEHDGYNYPNALLIASVKNNIVTGVAGGTGTVEDYVGSLSNVTDKATNGSEDTTGSAGLTGLSAANLFESTVPGFENLQIKSGAIVIDARTDLGTRSYRNQY